VLARFVTDEEHLSVLLSGDRVAISDRYSSLDKCVRESR
jgi:hypothetical protein